MTGVAATVAAVTTLSMSSAVASAADAVQPLDVSLTATGGVWNIGGLNDLPYGQSVALVLGSSGIPTPSETYVETAFNTYLAPSGLFDGDLSHVYALTTPELGYDTSGVLPRDQADIMAALVPLLQSGHEVTLFGYSQSAAAVNGALNELYDTYGDDVTGRVNFVLVGNGGSPDGIMNMIYASLPSWAQDILRSAAAQLSLDGGVLNFGEHEPSLYITPDHFHGSVFTLQGFGGMSVPDGYASWSPTSFADGSWFLQLLGLFTSHELYMGVSANDIYAALEGIDPNDMVHHIDLSPSEGFLTLLTAAGTNVGWIPEALGDPLVDFFSGLGI